MSGQLSSPETNSTETSNSPPLASSTPTFHNEPTSKEFQSPNSVGVEAASKRKSSDSIAGLYFFLSIFYIFITVRFE